MLEKGDDRIWEEAARVSLDAAEDVWAGLPEGSDVDAIGSIIFHSAEAICSAIFSLGTQRLRPLSLSPDDMKAIEEAAEENSRVWIDRIKAEVEAEQRGHQ